MFKNKLSNNPEAEIADHVRVAVHLTIRQFLLVEDQKGILPTGMTG